MADLKQKISDLPDYIRENGWKVVATDSCSRDKYHTCLTLEDIDVIEGEDVLLVCPRSKMLEDIRSFKENGGKHVIIRGFVTYVSHEGKEEIINLMNTTNNIKDIFHKDGKMRNTFLFELKPNTCWMREQGYSLVKSFFDIQPENIINNSISRIYQIWKLN